MARTKSPPKRRARWYGIVDIVNLAANPNKTNPLKAVITLPHKDMPLAALYYAKKDWILFVSGSSNEGGYLDVYDAKTLKAVSGSTFDYTSGSQAGGAGQIGLVSGKLFNDPKDDFAIVSKCDNGTWRRLISPRSRRIPARSASPLPTTSACGASYGVTGTSAGCSNSGNAVVFYPLDGNVR